MVLFTPFAETLHTGIEKSEARSPAGYMTQKSMKRQTVCTIFTVLIGIFLLALVLSLGLSVFRQSRRSGSEMPDQDVLPSSQTDLPGLPAAPEITDDQPEPAESPSNTQGSFFSIHFFDVGEGDSALVECEGHYMLIDGGSPECSSFLYAYLEQHEIPYLDCIVCSHAHADHVGGLSGALNYATVGTAYCSVTEYDSRAFRSFVKYLGEQNVGITVPSPGDTFSLGDATVTFLGPVDMSLADENENNSSIILRIDYGATSFLFTGDAEREEELSVVESGQNLHCTLLRVAHHGSYTSSSEEFLSAADPEYAVISVGGDNEYGHPHDSALDRLNGICDSLYRTDLNGEIISYSDGTHLSFETRR